MFICCKNHYLGWIESHNKGQGAKVINKLVNDLGYITLAPVPDVEFYYLNLGFIWQYDVESGSNFMIKVRDDYKEMIDDSLYY